MADSGLRARNVTRSWPLLEGGVHGLSRTCSVGKSVSEFRLVSVDPEIGPTKSTIDTMTARENISGDVPARLL
jgi:hypothetical protein